jgi:hypothetical protein
MSTAVVKRHQMDRQSPMHASSLADTFAVSFTRSSRISMNDNSICRVQPPKMTAHGILVSSTIWIVTCGLDFGGIQMRFAKLWKEQSLDIMCEIFWAILEDREESGFTTLATACLISSNFETIPQNASPTVERLWASSQLIESLPPKARGTAYAWWLVHHVMGDGVIHLVEMESPCPPKRERVQCDICAVQGVYRRHCIKREQLLVVWRS